MNDDNINTIQYRVVLTDGRSLIVDAHYYYIAEDSGFVTFVNSDSEAEAHINTDFILMFGDENGGDDDDPEPEPEPEPTYGFQLDIESFLAELEDMVREDALSRGHV